MEQIIRRNTAGRVSIGCIAALIFCCSLYPGDANAQEVQRSTLVAAYLYNFAQNIEWNSADTTHEFRFLLFGSDDRLLQELRTLAKTRKLRGKPITVTSSESLEACGAAHLIYVPSSREHLYPALFDRIEGNNVLTVTDGFSDKRLIMINIVEQSGGSLGFEINKANILNQHLTVMHDMVLLGGTEIDVAALYREGRESLRALRKRTEDLSGALRRQEDSIQAKRAEIAAQKIRLAEQTLEIGKQQKVLDGQTREFAAREKELYAQIKKARTVQEQFDATSRELELQRIDLRKGDEQLQQQQQTIHRQEEHIRAQSKALEEQGATIHRQRGMVTMLLNVIALVAVLVIAVLIGYRNNRKHARELEIAKERAEAADRLKSAFLATMSHELRTPLNSIIGFTGIILQGLVGELTAEQRKQLNMVRDSAHHLLALINDVLDISKIEAGQLELRREPFPIGLSIEKAVQVVRPLADKKALTIALDLASAPLTIFGDRRRIDQVLINLLNNAVKFTDTGGITISTGTTKGKTGANPGFVRVSICDTGIGIRAEDREKLFKPFRQIDTGTTRRYEGTGLGLSICQKLLALHGGEITVQSDGPGKGSTFTVLLPSEERNNG